MATKTITLTGAEFAVTGLDGAHAHIRNDGTDTIYASKTAGITAGADGVASIPAGQADTLRGISGAVYLLGTGSALIQSDDYVESPFKASTASGGSAVDDVARAAVSTHAGNADIHVTAEEKAGWSGKAELSDIPKTLPANGGNADTADTANVANVSRYQIEHILSEGTDILAFIVSDDCPIGVNTKVRILNCPTCPTNYGYIGTDNDFFYDIYKLFDKEWATVKAYDIRGNFEYMNSCANGSWSGWIKSNDGGNADTLDGLHANEISSNPNLLINPNFRINQRAETSYSTAGYTVDCWKLFSTVSGSLGSVTVSDDGVTLTGGDNAMDAYLCQFLEDSYGNKIAGKTVTVSFEVENVTGLGICVAQYGRSESSNLFARVTSDGKYKVTGVWEPLSITNRHALMFYNRDAYSSAKIKWVKLEIGSISSPFCPPDPATELAKCQRYYQIRSTGDIDPVDLRPSMATIKDIKQRSDGNYEYIAEL